MHRDTTCGENLKRYDKLTKLSPLAKNLRATQTLSRTGIAFLKKVEEMLTPMNKKFENFCGSTYSYGYNSFSQTKNVLDTCYKNPVYG
nr:unnamed protein product [Callosobruchus analis]